HVRTELFQSVPDRRGRLGSCRAIRQADRPGRMSGVSLKMKRVLPAIGLFLAAPLIAEYLFGNLPITMLGTLVVLAPMYGGGAILVRETVRRAGLGWPSMIVLALAYGVLEEELV